MTQITKVEGLTTITSLPAGYVIEGAYKDGSVCRVEHDENSGYPFFGSNQANYHVIASPQAVLDNLKTIQSQKSAHKADQVNLDDLKIHTLFLNLAGYKIEAKDLEELNKYNNIKCEMDQLVEANNVKKEDAKAFLRDVAWKQSISSAFGQVANTAVGKDMEFILLGEDKDNNLKFGYSGAYYDSRLCDRFSSATKFWTLNDALVASTKFMELFGDQSTFKPYVAQIKKYYTVPTDVTPWQRSPDKWLSPAAQAMLSSLDKD